MEENQTNLEVIPEYSVLADEASLQLYSDSSPFRLPLRISNFTSEADMQKFIKSCEGIVRKSLEYKLWKSYIIDVLGDNYCMITTESMVQCSIEVHHHVPSLYQLVKSIVNKKLFEGESFSTFDISLESIEVHFKNWVGYVCLVSTMHEKFHNGFLLIPRNLIKGNYQAFINEYSRYMDEDDLTKVNDLLSVENGNTIWTRESYPGITNPIRGH